MKVRKELFIEKEILEQLDVIRLSSKIKGDESKNHYRTLSPFIVHLLTLFVQAYTESND